MLLTYKTTFTEKKQLTSDVFLYKFKLTEPSSISFIPGQYVVLFVPQENGEKVRRLYSIASPNTTTQEFELLVKLIPNGCASCYLEKLNINDTVEFQGPAGMFILRESPRDKIFMVTGTGYAPVRSMLKSLMIDDRSLKIDFEAEKSKLEKNQTSIPQPQYPASSIQSPSSNSFYLFIGFPYYKDVFLFDELKKLSLMIDDRASKIGVEDRGSKIEENQSSTLHPQPPSSIIHSPSSKFRFLICLSREQNLDMIPEENRKYFFLGRVTNGLELVFNQSENSQITSSRLISDQFQISFDYYVCSGREIVDALKEYIYQKGAPKEQVFFEKF